MKILLVLLSVWVGCSAFSFYHFPKKQISYFDITMMTVLAPVTAFATLIVFGNKCAINCGEHE